MKSLNERGMAKQAKSVLVHLRFINFLLQKLLHKVIHNVGMHLVQDTGKNTLYIIKYNAVPLLCLQLRFSSICITMVAE